MPQGHHQDLGRSLAPVAAAIIVAAVVLVAPQLLNDGDTYWHIATGAWILDHGRVSAVDVFSYSRPGVRWVAHEWLSEVLMALAWRAAGWSGVVVLFACVMAAAGGLMVRRLSQALGGVTVLLISVMAFACMGGSLLARPQLFMVPIIVVWTSQLLSARAAGRAPRLPWALLMTLWANLHGSYVFGLLLAAGFGLEALIEGKARPGKAIREWGLFGVACLAACMVTPHGFAGLVYPFQIMTMTILPHIVEWRAADFSRASTFEVVLLITLFALLVRGVRVPPVRLLLVLMLLYMSLHHVRHLLVLAAVAPLLLADPVAQALGHAKVQVRVRPRLLAAGGVALVLLVGARLAWPVVRVDGAVTPMTALARIPTDLKNRPVLNAYGFGGYLIFSGVKPFIDGRSDMYGDAFSAEYFRATKPDPKALSRILRQYGVVWTIFPPDDPTVAALDADAGWRRLYTDRYAVVHLRSGPPPAG